MIPFSKLVQNFSSIKWNNIISSFYSFVFYLQKKQLEIVSVTILVAAIEATLILTGFCLFFISKFVFVFLWFWISVTNTCPIEVIPFVISLRFLECDSYCYCCFSCSVALQKLWPFSLPPPDQYYLCANFCSEIFQLKLTEKRLM